MNCQIVDIWDSQMVGPDRHGAPTNGPGISVGTKSIGSTSIKQNKITMLTKNKLVDYLTTIHMLDRKTRKRYLNGVNG